MTQTISGFNEFMDSQQDKTLGAFIPNLTVGVINKTCDCKGSRMIENRQIGTKPCWVCGSELPLMLFPSGCTAECASDLIHYGWMDDGKPSYLCNTHWWVLWRSEQRDACLVAIHKKTSHDLTVGY